MKRLTLSILTLFLFISASANNVENVLAQAMARFSGVKVDLSGTPLSDNTGKEILVDVSPLYSFNLPLNILASREPLIASVDPVFEGNNAVVTTEMNDKGEIVKSRQEIFQVKHIPERVNPVKIQFLFPEIKPQSLESLGAYHAKNYNFTDTRLKIITPNTYRFLNATKSFDTYSTNTFLCNNLNTKARKITVAYKSDSKDPVIATLNRTNHMEVLNTIAKRGSKTDREKLAGALPSYSDMVVTYDVKYISDNVTVMVYFIINNEIPKPAPAPQSLALKM
ncbi:hypothetical protein AAIR98_000664 [Elusimicrobium simillimum]|uniref:hypothetical protein n=1 Tax=Elusimicrobium simillimum TaxID=3143438 RepID=UPI003C6F469C